MGRISQVKIKPWSMLYRPACMLTTLHNRDFLQEARGRHTFPFRWRLAPPRRLFAQSWVLNSVQIPLLFNSNCLSLTERSADLVGECDSPRSRCHESVEVICHHRPPLLAPVDVLHLVCCQAKTGTKAACKCCWFLLLVFVSFQNPN